jgi:hypothetical protein
MEVLAYDLSYHPSFEFLIGGRLRKPAALCHVETTYGQPLASSGGRNYSFVFIIVSMAPNTNLLGDHERQEC